MAGAIRRLSTGIDGLDTILGGGLIEDRSYMVRGPAGSGKTVLGFHFLSAGVDAGENVLFINLEEDLDDLKTNAASLGFDVDAIEFLDLSPGADTFVEEESYDVFPASEVEQGPFTDSIVERVRESEPDRVVVDPLTQFRYLTSDEYEFRKQVVGFMRFLKQQGATVLFTTQERPGHSTEDLQFMCDGTISLTVTDAGRYISVPKFRGSATQSGTHTFRITDDGIVVFPELLPGAHEKAFTQERLSSGVAEIDDLLNGGIERGTITIISGPTGVGKTTLGTQFVKAAAERGERSVIYLFEESKRTFLTRSEAVNIPVEEMIDRGTLRVEEVDALDQSPQEFAQRVRTEVESNDTSMVMVDGIAGYRLTLRGEDDTITQHLHALGRYLKNMGVTTFLVDETSDLIGEFHATEEQVSYLADNIILLRHLELQGELQKAIGVLKQRTSDYERTLRRYEITDSGISVGDPFTDLRGVLTGTPERVE
jgi:circadian clock protein KaiC